MRVFLAAGFAAACVFAVAVPAERAVAQAATATASEDITGVWNGRRTSLLSGQFTEVSLELRQSGDKVVGSAKWGLSPSGAGGTGGPLEGERSGNKITFRVTSTELFKGNVQLSGDEIRGTLIGPYEYELVLRKQK